MKAQGKVIGYLQDHAFIKPVRGSKHMLLFPQKAWAIDAEVFDREVKPNTSKFVVIDRETGLEYHCSIEVFDRLKGELDRGFGKQYFLTLSHWEVRNNGYRQLIHVQKMAFPRLNRFSHCAFFDGFPYFHFLH